MKIIEKVIWDSVFSTVCLGIWIQRITVLLLPPQKKPKKNKFGGQIHVRNTQLNKATGILHERASKSL